MVRSTSKACGLVPERRAHEQRATISLGTKVSARILVGYFRVDKYYVRRRVYVHMLNRKGPLSSLLGPGDERREVRRVKIVAAVVARLLDRGEQA